MKKRYSKEQMYELIRRWESSGELQKIFLQKHDIPRSTFGYYRMQYLKEQSTPKGKKNFIPVHVDKSEPTGDTHENIELIYPNGVRLICSSAMDLSKLKPLILL